MRTIKFRAWDKRRKEMCVVSSLEFLFETEHGICASVPNSEFSKEAPLFTDIFPEDLELMQFTGLLDKNGKEIYEGDLIAFSAYFGPVGDVKEDKVGEVKYLPTRFVIEYWNEWRGYDGQVDNFDLTRFGENNIEVIGNIYENPELLSVAVERSEDEQAITKP